MVSELLSLLKEVVLPQYQKKKQLRKKGGEFLGMSIVVMIKKALIMPWMKIMTYLVM